MLTCYFQLSLSLVISHTWILAAGTLQSQGLGTAVPACSLYLELDEKWSRFKKKDLIFVFCNIFLQDFSISMSFSAYALVPSVFLSLLFLDYMFPSHVFSPLLFHSDIRFCHYFCFPFVDCILFHFHFFPIFSIVLS